VKAFKHCCDVLSIDGTFLTGKYEGTMLIAIGIDANRQLMPLAFVIVEKENNSSCGWFLCLVQIVAIGPGREICVISDMHVRILNAMRAQSLPCASSLVHMTSSLESYQT
jgi:hypothetical protein